MATEPPDAPPRRSTFEAAKASSSYLLPYFLALAGMLWAVGEIQMNRNATILAYRDIENKVNIALTRQEEVVSRLRRIEADLAENRKSLERITERYAPRPKPD
jgi:uncharacterized protein HemX